MAALIQYLFALDENNNRVHIECVERPAEEQSQSDLVDDVDYMIMD